MEHENIEKTTPENNGVQTGMSPKTIAIISYITIIGWVIAFVLNQEKKDEFATFHIRQMLGIGLFGIAISVVNVIPLLGQIVWLLGIIPLLVFWVMGLMSALNGTKKTVPLLGDKFQEWFATI